ncbi:uncharacterized protein LOC131671541 [Phymastichus coffea]|uniref:uncharacterized protein LOC131671541 n=1 Tax=Phymastichus coffea TaxID=108790 RepID=UPI00273CA8DF|nr:uncharacterized protein LOC131671541 [Phymastichus coffea]
MGSRSGMYASMLVMVAITVCYAAPSFKPKSEWPIRHNGEEAPAILTSNCDPAIGRCWEWLPLDDRRHDEYAVKRDAEFNRGQPIRTRAVDRVTADSWPRATTSAYGRPAKKDMFMSRGWGAGGMPFSVLYMSPRANHHAASTAQAKAHKNHDPTRKHKESSPPLPLTSQQQQQQQHQQSNYRVSLRNGIHGSQPRRQYSIIPQLFISYGWGPSGK